MCILNKELFLFYFYFLLLINIESGHKHVDKLQQRKQYVCSNKQNGKTYSEKIVKKALKLKNKIKKNQICSLYSDKFSIFIENSIIMNSLYKMEGQFPPNG